MKEREAENKYHAILYIIIAIFLIIVALVYGEIKESRNKMIIYDGGFFEIIEVGGKEYYISKDIYSAGIYEYKGDNYEKN